MGLFPSPFEPGRPASSPLGPVGTLTDWYSGLPSTPSLPKSKSGERKLKDRGMTSEMARKTRIGRDGWVVDSLSIFADGNISQHSDLAIYDMDSTDAETMRLLQNSADFLAQRYHRGRYGRKGGDTAEHKRISRHIDTLDQDLFMPRLMGVTSGFADKDPVPSCPWTRPPKGGWPKAERHLVKDPTPGAEEERPLSRSESHIPFNKNKLPPVDSRGSRGGNKVITPGSLKPRNSILGPDGRPSVKLNVRTSSKPQAATHRDSKTDITAKPSDLQGVSHAKARLSGTSLGRNVAPAMDWRALYDSHLSSSTHYYLQERGVEGGPKQQTTAALVKSASQPSLPKSACLPPESWLSTDTEGERDTLSPLQRSCSRDMGYLRGCRHEKINPRLVKFLAAPGSKLDVQALLLGDNDLEAVAEALTAPNRNTAAQEDWRGPVIHINLSHNKRLSDFAVANFLTTILKGSHIACGSCVGPLKSLNLSHCTAVGESTMSVLAMLLGQGSELIALAELDLSGIALPVRSWSAFTEGLKIRRGMRRLCLAQTQCGRQSQQSCIDVAGLIEDGACRNLEYFDISGNHFLHEGCQAIARSLQCTSDALQEIDLSHNAGFASRAPMPEEEADSTCSGFEGNPTANVSHPVSFNPIMHVLEVLGETTVTRVSFANCQLQYAEDCILEDVIASSDITHLDVADNPHGEQGLRCLVRLLVKGKQDGLHLERLNLHTVRSNAMLSETLRYDYVDPSARYELNLENPQHRAILRLLLKRGEQFTKGNGQEFTCFEDTRIDGRSMANGMRDLCSKRVDRGGDDWQVPQRGILKFAFTQPPFYHPMDDIGTVFVKFTRTQKVIVNFNGFSRLQSLYRTLPDERSKLMMISAMGSDLVFKLCQVRSFMRLSSDLFLFIVVTLLPAVEEQAWQHSRMLLFGLVDECRGKGTEQMVRQIKAETQSMLYFNARHADGRYVLNLSNKVDRGIAQRCIVISNWMKNKSITLNLLDLSENENQECLRNTKLGKNWFPFDSDKFQLPEDGMFSYDLVLPRLKLDEAKITDPELLDRLRETLKESICNFRDKLRALRLIAHRLILRPEDLRDMIEVFPEWHPRYGRGNSAKRKSISVGETKEFKYDFRPRAEAYILFYNRTVFHSEVVSPNILYNDEIFHRDEVKEIRSRLGYIHTFDVMNAHEKGSNLGNKHGPLDMTTYDGRATIKLLMAVSFTEPSPNFYFTEWSEKAEFAARGYAFIIPATWVTEGIPHKGEFLTTFQSHNEEVNYEKRQEIAKNHLGWTFPPDLKTPSGRAVPSVLGLTGLSGTEERASSKSEPEPALLPLRPRATSTPSSSDQEVSDEED